MWLLQSSLDWPVLKFPIHWHNVPFCRINYMLFDLFFCFLCCCGCCKINAIIEPPTILLIFWVLLIVKRFAVRCTNCFGILFHIFDETVLYVFDDSVTYMIFSPQKENVARYSSFAAACILFSACQFLLHIFDPNIYCLTKSGSSPTSPTE